MTSNNEVILEEIEALKAIMMDEVNVCHNQREEPSAVVITVKPATAQNIEEQHVRVTLIVNLPVEYPDEPPTISLRNPRGIDDDVIKLIEEESVKKCEEYLGLPVIYELIELVREKLTANNTPSCPCAICLFHFTDNDHFSKTPCFHYFHSNCLGRYILNCEETAAAEEKENQQPVWMTREKRHLLCPVCREPLKEEINGSSLLANPPPEEGNMLTDFNPSSPEIKALQDRMKRLYLHQKSIGGIINLEEEKNKFLISAAVVSNIESLPPPAEEKAQMLPPLTKEGKQGKVIENKGSSQSQRQSSNYVKRGANKPGPNQGKRDYSSHNAWWSGRTRNNKKGNKVRTNNSSGPDPTQNTDSPNVCEGRQSFKNTPKPGPNKNSSRNLDSQYDSSLPSNSDDNRKINQRNFYRNSVPLRGSGSVGMSARGVQPPGFSELERNVRSHTTS